MHYKEKISQKITSFFGEKKQNENITLTAGFALIFLVIIFTLFRGSIFSDKSKTKSQSAVSSSQDQKATFDYDTISATDLNKKILISNKKESLTLLDIRPFDAYIQEHIMDAVNIAIDEFPVASKINAHSLVVVIGASNTDKDISAAVDKLKDEDFENIVVLAGGMISWKQLIGSTVSYGDPKSFIDQSKVSYLDPEKLNDAITQKVPVYIIDVRDAGEFNAGHIVGAKNIPIDELEKRRGEITEKRIVVVGANELQEFQASVQMYDMLLASPFVMRTAIPGWQQKGFSLVK
ncbi:MAG: rhodanese-like domain-containing protein [Candidatus Moranbacteria bacterium]|nr:rhodanese-like domain-containing protein [Candidatus Moranbacteria bacterium]